MGATDRRRPERHIPGPPVLGERRAPELRASASRRRRRERRPPERCGILDAYATFEEDSGTGIRIVFTEPGPASGSFSFSAG